ncbi:MAG TPA: phosphoribosylformylglycinamidine synthase, partial [Nitrospiraceae bacterium]|nr:phosphoribosylformylglycinamidine synthase [Nitrospiraceae bacterium]
MPHNKLLHRYRSPALSAHKKAVLLKTFRERINPDIQEIETEFCFNIETSGPLTDKELGTLQWLLAETFEPEKFSDKSFLTLDAIFEVGPRMNFTTAWSTNAVSVCHACGLTKIKRIERSRRYKFVMHDASSVMGLNDISSSLSTHHSSLFYDRMTECPYPEPLNTFDSEIKPEAVKIIPLMEA